MAEAVVHRTEIVEIDEQNRAQQVGTIGDAALHRAQRVLDCCSIGRSQSGRRAIGEGMVVHVGSPHGWVQLLVDSVRPAAAHQLSIGSFKHQSAAGKRSSSRLAHLDRADRLIERPAGEPCGITAPPAWPSAYLPPTCQARRKGSEADPLRTESHTPAMTPDSRRSGGHGWWEWIEASGIELVGIGRLRFLLRRFGWKGLLVWPSWSAIRLVSTL